MDTLQIRRELLKLPPHVSRGVYSIDTIPHPDDFPCAFVVNKDTSGGEGTHWVALFFRNGPNDVYYFDSFGCPAPAIVHKMFPWVREWTVPVQGLFSDSCGHYCLIFLRLFARGFTEATVRNILTGITDRDAKRIIQKNSLRLFN